MQVKICGIKSLDAAMSAVEAGADLIGFVFADSKRRISPSQAKQIADHIPSAVKKVGVFVNEDAEKMNEIAEYVGLDFIQLHGDETPEDAMTLNRPIIKAFSIDGIFEIESFPCDYYLIDSPSGRYRGGTGLPFNWEKLHHTPLNKDQLILAGGLNEENVAEAIAIVKPALLDVSSGVETNGEKDPEKMRSFVKEAKRAFQQLKESEGNDNIYTTK